MSAQFKVGDICVGQNFVIDTHSNGVECVVVGGLQIRWWWHPDGTSGEEPLYVVRWSDGSESRAAPFNLRRKRPPTTGEQSIMTLFNAPPVERRETTTAWRAPYDTMQALMAMGVRVRVGKWMVGVV